MGDAPKIDRFHRIESAILAFAIVAGIVYRLTIGWRIPLWLDETYTGVIASQPGPTKLIDWCLHELSGPVYYALVWLWSSIAGISNTALRIPSVVFSIAAISLIAFAGHADRRTRLIWAALAALWMPDLFYAVQARPQALLFLMATGQAILFGKSWQQGDRRYVTGWACLTALLLLTHIYAAVISGLQGLALLYRFRGSWLRLWPAVLPFLPVALWMSVHLPFILSFAQSSAAWYPVMGLTNIQQLGRDLFGYGIVAFVMSLALLASLLTRKRTQTTIPSAESLLLIVGILSVLVIFGTGMLRSSYNGRYLVPCIPALLFGIAAVLRDSPLLGGKLPSLVIAFCLLQVAFLAAAAAPLSVQRRQFPLQFESASEWLMDRRARAVIFTWDNPATAINADTRLAEIGGFFFNRTNHPVDLHLLRMSDSPDWNRELIALSRAKDADILWVGGDRVPAPLMAMPEFECRRFGQNGTSQSLACHRVTKATGLRN